MAVMPPASDLPLPFLGLREVLTLTSGAAWKVGATPTASELPLGSY